MSINILSSPKSFSHMYNLLKQKKVFLSLSVEKQKPLLKHPRYKRCRDILLKVRTGQRTKYISFPEHI